jgi:hypothetical protein
MTLTLRLRALNGGSSGSGRESRVLQRLLREWQSSLTGRSSLHNVHNPAGLAKCMLRTLNSY